jgi:RHS repeat-associated protein
MLPTTTYTRGKDLSGSLEGAGGMGGLLARTAQSYVDAPMAGQSFYHADGNGNITMLINSSQAVVAKYLYDAFGNVLSKSGLLADANLYQFSSKEKHLNSGLVYYLYRYYDPNLQRWPNRDPLGDLGFVPLQQLGEADSDLEDADSVLNLYLFAGNDSLQNVDYYGLVCSVVADRTKSLMSRGINAGHEWIEYNSTSVGFWPRYGYKVLRPDPGQTTPFPISWQWDTLQRSSGTIKWGPAAGKSCTCATCADITASLDAVPNPGWHSFDIVNNCRRFVKWAFKGSCLEKGHKTSLNP